MSVNGNGIPARQPGPPPSNPAAENAQLAMIQQALASMQAALQEKISVNRAGLEELARRGIQLDPVYILDLQIATLRASVAETMGAGGQVWEMHARLAYEDAVASFIDHARTEGAKAQLGLGGSLSAAAIRQMARKTGTYGG